MVATKIRQKLKTKIEMKMETFINENKELQPYMLEKDSTLSSLFFHTSYFYSIFLQTFSASFIPFL